MIKIMINEDHDFRVEKITVDQFENGFPDFHVMNLPAKTELFEVENPSILWKKDLEARTLIIVIDEK